MAIANFDQQVKANLYPLVMQFENVIKNEIINQVVCGIDPSFDNIYKEKLTYYKSLPRNSGRAYYNAVNKRLKLKKIVDSSIAIEYQNRNKLITHYVDNYQPVPLWALFEIISLGNIGQFMWTLQVPDRIEIAKFFNVYDRQYDSQANFIRQAIYLVRDLRNAIAHNHIIFDCRFKGDITRIPNNVKGTMRQKINLNNNIDFNELFDYLALLTIILKESGTSKTQLKKYIMSFKESIDQLYKSTQTINLSYSIYSRVVGEDINNKVDKLLKYVHS